ncbi:MAG: hypothetical protein LBP75_01940 [Planctomycetota bacterium]|jgi:putative CRISPR-associated protein (TIGR02619 family)|nr:hypothetical protein [Planctomycetota bacterium]
MPKLNLMLSTCGTSILTNGEVDADTRKLLTKHANAKTAEEIRLDERQIIETHLAERERNFLATSLADAPKSSAELAGIIAYYRGQLSDAARDAHYLLATDTWLGGRTAQLTADWLQKNGVANTQIYPHPDLQTADWRLFSSSLTDLVKWCDETLRPCRDNYNTVFNLSGGFKSETGFLQVLGMFYADETVYIFERSAELMRIPHLPVKMDDESDVAADLRDFRRAALGLSVSGKNVGLYWLEIDGANGLTPWGELIFRNIRDNLYRKEIYPSISDRIIFGNNFQKTATNFCNTPEKIAHLNESIDLLAKNREGCAHPNPKNLNFEALQNNRKGEYSFRAWHNDNGARCLCRMENNGVVIVENIVSHSDLDKM